VRALKVVEGHEDIEVALDLVGPLVPLGPALDAEALVGERLLHALHKAVGAGRADLRLPHSSDRPVAGRGEGAQLLLSVRVQALEQWIQTFA
jgi:hypothetical protein